MTLDLPARSESLLTIHPHAPSHITPQYTNGSKSISLRTNAWQLTRSHRILEKTSHNCRPTRTYQLLFGFIWQIPNTIAFGLLVFEISTFIVLIVPLPFTWRRALFRSIAQSPIIAKVQYGLKISFIGIALLFADAVQSMMKLHREGQQSKELGQARDLRGENDFRARKFLSERNFYLTVS